MCGIAGFAGNGSFDDLTAMTAELRFRGPDASGHEIVQTPAGPIFLGHRRLSVVDVSGGAQPMFSRNGHVTIVFNGEIYNHMDIRRELERRGYGFATSHSDTETLLAGYSEYGEDIVNQLNGMFAFVILDVPRQRLFGARDRFGEKPLYYRHDGDFFAFASELTALAQHPNVGTTIDQSALIKLCAYGFIPAPLSLLKGVQKLEPGGTFSLDLRTSTLKTGSYFRYANKVDSDLEKASDQDVADEILSLLSRSVERRMMSDVPLGVLLSGGLDSSLITALMAEQTAAPVGSFSIGFDDPSYDERAYSNHVSQALETSHHLSICRMSSLIDEAPRILERLDEAFCDASILPTWMVCRDARRHVTVALTGDGGDELFAGYDPFAAIGPAKLAKAALPLPLLDFLRSAAERLPRSGKNMSLDFRIRRALSGILHSPPLWTPVWMAPLTIEEINDFFGTTIDAEEIYSEAVTAWDCSPSESIGQKMIEYFINFYLPNDILTKSDRASMQNSLELRAPFLDTELTDFVARLPYRFKKRGRVRKYALKLAAERKLARHIISRKKKGFGIPLHDWMKDRQFHKASPILAGINQGLFDQFASEHAANSKDHRFFLWINAVLASFQSGRSGPLS